MSSTMQCMEGYFFCKEMWDDMSRIMTNFKFHSSAS